MRRAPAAPIAVEVELTAKSAHRLDEILRAWRRSLARGQFTGVHYRCSPAALPYVERAVTRIGSDWGIDIAPLDRQLGKRRRLARL